MKTLVLVSLLLVVIKTKLSFLASLLNGINGLTKKESVSTRQNEDLSSFAKKHKRAYSSTNELTYRNLVFKQNWNLIDSHNQNTTNKYTLGITGFTDFTKDEFIAKLLFRKLPIVKTTTSTTTSTTKNYSVAKNFTNPTLSPSTQTLKPVTLEFSFNLTTKNVGIASSPALTTNKTSPTSSSTINWKQKNMTGIVKNQGLCGSCYAFSALSSIEAMYLVNNMTTMGLTGKSLGTQQGTTFSEQQIVDCCNIADRCDMGCNGGYVWDVYTYVSINGLSIEQTYPYRAQAGDYTRSCDGIKGEFKHLLNPSNPYTNVSSNVEALKQAVLKRPVSVLIDATNLPLYLIDQSSKVVPFDDCGNQNNHAVLLVGVDQSGNWLIKNSWGSEWGQDGYITLAPGNTCGIANYATYPNPYS